MKDLRTLLYPMLKYPKKSNRAISKLTQMPRRTVDRYRILVRASGASSEELLSMTDQQLDAVFNRQNPKSVKAQPNVADVVQSMAASQSTVKDHWLQHQADHGRYAYSYAQYWRKVRAYRTARVSEEHARRESRLVSLIGTFSADMRQQRKPVDKCAPTSGQPKRFTPPSDDVQWPQEPSFEGYSPSSPEELRALCPDAPSPSAGHHRAERSPAITGARPRTVLPSQSPSTSGARS